MSAPVAHLVTTSRLLLALPCAWLIATGRFWLAAALFTLAVITDVIDGRIARAQGTASNFGGLLDHCTDAIFVALGLASLAYLGQVSWLLPPLVVLAFLQYTLDSKALAGAQLRANWLGRTNGICYYVLCGIGIGLAALIPLASSGANVDNLLRYATYLTLTLSWILVLTTLTSMANRFLTWRKL